VADSRQFIEYASSAAAAVAKLASIPSGADNAIIRADSGTMRWSETTGSWLNASIGPLLSSADPPFRIGVGVPLSAFAFCPVGGAGAIMVSYYSYRGIGNFL